MMYTYLIPEMNFAKFKLEFRSCIGKQSITETWCSSDLSTRIQLIAFKLSPTLN